MRRKRQILIATTNKGKLEEVKAILIDLPFDFLSFGDIGHTGTAPMEVGHSLLENAIIKAMYYGEMYQMITLSDDSGLFVDALHGWPGVESARVADGGQAQCQMILEKMSGVPESHRGASFKNALALYDPATKNLLSSAGEVRGHIAAYADRSVGHHGFGYDPIFFYGPKQKTFSQMSLAEKNTVSHRGSALFRMKYLLENQYGGKHIVVPLALIINNGRVLVSKRNDPLRPEFHEKWEFPGGKLDIGETIEENIFREVLEEVGLKVTTIKRLSMLWIEQQDVLDFTYQIYLIPYVCRIESENGSGNDAEVLETRWVHPEEVLELELMGSNKTMYEQLLPELLAYITEKSL